MNIPKIDGVIESNGLKDEEQEFWDILSAPHPQYQQHDVIAELKRQLQKITNNSLYGTTIPQLKRDITNVAESVLCTAAQMRDISDYKVETDLYDDQINIFVKPTRSVEVINFEVKLNGPFQ